MKNQTPLQAEMYDAERKAWEALARYKFWMFGYWAGIWIHLNRISGARKANPWKELVRTARTKLPSVVTAEGVRAEDYC